MAAHPKLAEFKDKRYFRTFNKYLNGIEADLGRAGVINFEAELLTVASPSLLGLIGTALFRPVYGKAQEALIVTTQIYECPVEIMVPIGNGKLVLPYSIAVILPGSFPGRVVCERNLLFGFSWQSEPKNNALVKQLKKAVPKAMTEKKKEFIGSAYYGYELEQCYAFQPTRSGNTQWLINSCYEGGWLPGGYRPRVTRYIEAIPNVKRALSSW